VHYEGNPLIESIEDYKSIHPERQKFIERHSLDDSHSIALLAGSRKAEISFLLPRMVAFEKLLRQNQLLSGYQLLLAAAPSVDMQLYRSLIPTDSSIRIVSDDTYGVLSHSEAAIISSGTASLEAALIGTPQVVCYGFNRITYLIARLLVRVKYISLANLILDKFIFKEFVQDEASPKMIFDEVSRLLTDKEYRSTMKSDYTALREVLGGSGASCKIARKMIGLLKENNVNK
jgi:lipid-A-disaccharide synthase